MPKEVQTWSPRLNAIVNILRVCATPFRRLPSSWHLQSGISRLLTIAARMTAGWKKSSSQNLRRAPGTNNAPRPFVSGSAPRITTASLSFTIRRYSAIPLIRLTSARVTAIGVMTSFDSVMPDGSSMRLSGAAPPTHVGGLLRHRMSHSTGSQAMIPNHAMERTAGRRMTRMKEELRIMKQATRALVRRRSSCSR
jgi:hypothetical protein